MRGWICVGVGGSYGGGGLVEGVGGGGGGNSVVVVRFLFGGVGLLFFGCRG